MLSKNKSSKIKGKSLCLNDGFILSIFPALILLWIGLSPKGFAGVQYVNYPIIFIISFIPLLLKKREVIVIPSGVIILMIFLLWWFATLISFLININDIRIGAIVEIGKPILFLSIFFCSYYSYKEYGKKGWIQVIGSVSKVLIVTNLLVSTIQIFSVEAFSFIWSTEKTRGIESIFRITGTMYNPNTMALFMSILCFSIIAGQGMKRSIHWIVLTVLLIILAGSRTVMIAFPFALAVMHWCYLSGRKEKILRGTLKIAGIATVLLVTILGIISLFSDHLPYARQLLLLFSGDINTGDISSFAHRQMSWERKIKLWMDDGSSIIRILFGAGSIEQLTVGDNDLIYVVTRLGLYGLIIHILMYIILFFMSWRSRYTSVGVWMAGTLTLLVIAGITLDTLGGWLPSIYVSLMAGASYASLDTLEMISNKNRHLTNIISKPM